MVTVNELDALEVFNEFSSEQKKKIAAISKKKKTKKGGNVYLSQYRASRLFVVINGQVALQVLNSDESVGLTFGTLEGGQLFGGASMLRLQEYTIAATCRMDTELLVMESDDLFDLIAEDYKLGFRIMKKVSEIYLSRYLTAKKQLNYAVNTSQDTIMAAPG